VDVGCYATEITVRLLARRRAAKPASRYAKCSPRNSFEAALRSLVLQRLGKFYALAGFDGSWPSAPILRLTYRDVYAR